MNERKIELYETTDGKVPVQRFLDDLPRAHKAKAFQEIELLALFGADLKMPHAKHLDGKLWELRIMAQGDISRIIYFIPTQEKIVLLNGFIKKTNKTPPTELNRAKKYLSDWESRFAK